MRHALLFPSIALAATLTAAPAHAQDPVPPPTAVPPATAVAQPPAGAEEPKLVFEREVFRYPGGARRDPFRALTNADETGPMFQDLTLRMIVYSAAQPARSIVMVRDGAAKSYRLRRGDVVGNATVVDIGRYRVVFSVEDFGIRRQEVLELKPNNREGA